MYSGFKTIYEPCILQMGFVCECGSLEVSMGKIRSFAILQQNPRKFYFWLYDNTKPYAISTSM